MNSLFKKNLEKRETKNGFGIFAKADLPKDTVILEFHGPIMTSAELPNPLPSNGDYYLQVGQDTFIGPSGDVDDFVNHSCSPNCGVFIVGNRALLKSIMLIPKGIEITFDYASTSTDTSNDWSMSCQCKSFACRKIVSGFKYLNDGTKARYRSLGIVPGYVEKK